MYPAVVPVGDIADLLVFAGVVVIALWRRPLPLDEFVVVPGIAIAMAFGSLLAPGVAGRSLALAAIVVLVIGLLAERYLLIKRNRDYEARRLAASDGLKAEAPGSSGVEDAE